MVTEFQNLIEKMDKIRQNKIIFFKTSNGYGINYINYFIIYNLYVSYDFLFAPGSKT